jgi:sugar phosphate isomerase/epimerase
MKSLAICDNGNALEAAPLCRKFKVGIEIQAFYDPYLIEKNPEAVSNHLDVIKGIEPCTLHGPFGDLCPGSFDAMLRDVARNRFEFAFSISRQLGASYIILHHGYVPGTSFPDRWLTRSTAFWTEFLQDKSNAHFYIENMLERDPDLLSELVAAVDSPNFNVCLDIGHAHCHSETPVLQWIEKLGEKIQYVHLHNNYGETDEHLGLGNGTIPMLEVCYALDEFVPDAIWAIEVNFPFIDSSIAWLRRHGFYMQKRHV